VQSWRGIVGKERAFLMDTAYDLIRVVDYLLIRPDVDAARIGMTGRRLSTTYAIAICSINAPAWVDWSAALEPTSLVSLVLPLSHPPSPAPSTTLTRHD
jgi:cephalosporin-C deacetylase-like acetyl esterase